MICGGTTAGGALQNVSSLGTAGYLLTSNGPGALPTFQNGVASGIINTGALNDLAYYSTNPTGKTLSAITTSDSAVLTTSGMGVPQWLANGTAGYVLTAQSGAPPAWEPISAEGAITTIDGDSGSVSPSSGVVTISGGSTGLTTSGSSATLTFTGILNLASGGTNADLTAGAGKMVYSTASAMALTAVGTSGQLLQSAGTSAPGWTTNTYPSTDSKGDILYASAVNTIGGLAIGSTNNILTVTAGLPAWSGLSALMDSVLGATQGDILYRNSTVWTVLAPSTSGYVLTTGGAAANPSWRTAVTATGAITTIDGDSGSVSPSSGVVTISGGTTGLTTIGSSATLDLTGTLKLGNGGTNASLTASNGGIFYSTASAGAILSGTATANQILMSGSSTTPAWSTATYPATAGTQYNVLQSTGTNITSATLTSVIDGAIGSTQGDVLYRNSTVWTVLAPGTSGQVLTTGGAAANPSWTSIAGAYSVPQITVYTSGSAQTYTTPAGALYLLVEMVGGGGGGGAFATNAGNAGGNTSFGTLTANGGSGGGTSGAAGGAGGTASNGDVNITGATGRTATNLVATSSGDGGSSYFGGSAPGSQATGASPNAGIGAVTNSGSGGSGASGTSSASGAGGGGAGGYCTKNNNFSISNLYIYSWRIRWRRSGWNSGRW